MQFQQIDRSDPEKVYAAIYNVSGTTLSAGAACYHVVASGDGISVSNAGTTRKWAFAGIVKDAIADSTYGRAQVHGICSAYMVLADTTSAASPGDQLNAVNSATYLKHFSAASDVFTFVAVSSATLSWTGGNPWNYVTLLDTYASAASGDSTAALKTVFVKAM